MKLKDFEFPPSFLFNPLQKGLGEIQKRDLHRCRKLCKELRRSFSLSSKKKPKVLKSLAEIYQRLIELDIEITTKKFEKVEEDLIFTYSELTESLSLYSNWKKNGYESSSNSLLMNCGPLEDCIPKHPPSPDILSKSIEKLENFDLLKSSEREDSTFRDEIENADLYKLREKLLDTEDLVQMYKADLSKLQVKYLEATEGKEELMYRINAILFSIREINKILTDTKKSVEELTRLNFSLNEDLEAYKSQNECLKSSIREIQDSLIKVEKEASKNKKYIEILENGNAALVASNSTLKFELEKSKKEEQALEIQLKKIQENKPPVAEIFMNPRLLGDIENSYNISISDSESVL